MNTCTRLLIERDPGLSTDEFQHHLSAWPAHWIAGPGWDGERTIVWAFRREFHCSAPSVVRIHATADQRYDLYLDGERIGWGSERGDHGNWFYESYELRLDAGRHTLVARVWWTGLDKLAHYGHSTVRPAFLLHAEKEWAEQLDTGVAAWQACELAGYRFVVPQVADAFHAVGGRTILDAARQTWGFEFGAGDEWSPATLVSRAVFRAAGDEEPFQWLLRPGTLPPMHERRCMPGRVRHASRPAELNVEGVRLHAADHDAALAADWTAMLAELVPVDVPPRSVQRIVIDLDDYYCAWPELAWSGGHGAEVRIGWAESLFDEPRGFVKGNRDVIEAKFFRGMHDSVLCDGGANRVFEPLWWEAGRFVELLVVTHDEPLRIEGLTLRETHYPHSFVSEFACDDPRWEAVFKLSKRVLEMCSHESYMDCPYYEQLMYVGDTRLEVLATYATTRDDRLPRKAIELFDRSRSEAGLTMSRCPSRVKQIIPPFSLWWIHMLHDYAMWRDDASFVRARMPGVRAVLEAFRERLDPRGLIVAPLGWNFVDWVGGWSHGMPPSAAHGVNATINLHVAWTLRVAAELEELAGEPLLARRNRETADRISNACLAAFWDAERGLFAEDADRAVYSEHAQCMALLGGSVPSHDVPKLAKSLLAATDLARATVYFRHYLFETFRLLGRVDALYDRLQLWFDLPGQGLRTVVESPEPTRSDCHAWGAHPMFHAFATICGIRPAAPGFREVRIEPQLGPLRCASATLGHPRGSVELAIRREGERWTGRADTPSGVPSTLVLPDGRELRWDGGSQTF